MRPSDCAAGRLRFKRRLSRGLQRGATPPDAGQGQGAPPPHSRGRGREPPPHSRGRGRELPPTHGAGSCPPPLAAGAGAGAGTRSQNSSGSKTSLVTVESVHLSLKKYFSQKYGVLRARKTRSTLTQPAIMEHFVSCPALFTHLLSCTILELVGRRADHACLLGDQRHHEAGSTPRSEQSAAGPPCAPREPRARD